MKKKFLALAAAAAVSACAQQQAIKPYDYTTFRHDDPHSVLVVPVVNSSNEADAPDFFLTTLPMAMAEKGYYVFPVNMVKNSMEADGLGDAALVRDADPKRLGSLFHSDSILYVEILNWDSNYNVLSAGITVAFKYTMKDAKTGETLWENKSQATLQQSGNSGNILADLLATAIVGAINSMKSDYTPVAKMANVVALSTAGRGIPSGPYSQFYKTDADMKAYPQTGTGWVGDRPDPEAAAPAATPAADTAKTAAPAQSAGTAAPSK